MLSNDEKIAALRLEAIDACDVVQIYLCDLALSDASEHISVEDYLLDHDEQRSLAEYTRHQARNVCLEVCRAAACGED